LKWLLFNVLRSNGYGGRAILISQIFNCIAGALGVSFMFLTVRYFTKNLFTAVIASSVLCFSYGFWYCSTFGGVRVMGISFLILLFFILFYFSLNEENKYYKNIIIIVLAGIVHCFVIFSHQTHAMFLPVVIAAIFLKKDKMINKLTYFLVYCLILTGVVAGLYYYIGVTVYHLKTKEGFYGWLTSLANAGVWGKLTSDSVSKAYSGFKVTLTGGLFAGKFPYADIRNIDIISILYYALCAACIYGLSSFLRIAKKHYKVIIGCLLWLAIYIPFFIWWEPENFEFWIYPLPAFIILFSLPVSDLLNRWKKLPLKISWKIFWIIIIFVLTLMFICHNIFNIIVPHSDASKSIYQNMMKNINDNSNNSDDLVIITGTDALITHVKYFCPRDYLSAYEEIRDCKGDETLIKKDFVERINSKLNEKRKVLLQKDILSLGNIALLKKIFTKTNLQEIGDCFKENYILTPLKTDSKNLWFYEIERKRK
jgi:hypothetical protein